MALILIAMAIASGSFYLGMRFYRSMNWDEPAEPTPDLAQARRREAELLHLEEILREAHDQGKLSAGFMQEFRRFSDQELAASQIDSSSKKC